jgi:hypothetical protein
LTDIAIPVLSILLFLIVNHFLRPVCNRFRDYQLHFSNLLWGLVIINVFSYLPSFSKTTNYLVMSVVISLAIALMILYNVIKHVKITKAEKALLTKQKQMTEEHAASIQQQTEQMETYHQAADTQISAFDSENLQSYVENLKQQQQKVWGGTYCSDHMIDAILASQTEKMKNKGYSLQCHLFGYDRGCIAEKDLAQLLMYIFAWSEESVSSKSTSDHSIDLRMSVVTNQLMIEYRMPSANHTNNVRRMLHPLVKKYHGKIGWQKEGTYDVLNIMLERAFLSLL